MRFRIFLLFLLATSGLVQAQTKCEWTTEVNDSLGTFKALKDFVLYENRFGSSDSYIFVSLQERNGVPCLNLKDIRKGKDFIPGRCFSKNSRVLLQLDNGKVITLLQAGDEDCGQSVFDGQYNSMITEGVFVFIKGTVEDLKASPVSILRVRYATETKDYPMASEFKSGLTQETYRPQRYFMDHISCLFP